MRREEVVSWLEKGKISENILNCNIGVKDLGRFYVLGEGDLKKALPLFMTMYPNSEMNFHNRSFAKFLVHVLYCNGDTSKDGLKILAELGIKDVSMLMNKDMIGMNMDKESSIYELPLSLASISFLHLLKLFCSISALVGLGRYNRIDWVFKKKNIFFS